MNRPAAEDVRAELDSDLVKPDVSRATVPGEGLPSTAEVEAKRKALEAAGVRYCLSSYVDVHGVPKAKSVPLNHFGRAVRGSELFTGAALDGLGQGPHDDELALFPDLDAVCQLPWRPDIAWMPGNLRYHDEAWPMCSRTILSQQIARAHALGFRLNLGIECELFLVNRVDGKLTAANPKDVIPKAAYDVVGLLENMDWLDEMVSHMNALGWDVHSFDHEDANSQFEFDFSYTDALSMADRYVLLRLMAKTLARKHGCEVTFMPKPFANKTGSAAHFNMSLESLETGKNVFGDAADRRGCGLSDVAYRFLAGVLRHAGAIIATTCPTVNSYKRLISSGSVTGYTWAPVFISYGGNNRTHMMRVPKIQGKAEELGGHSGRPVASSRLECRAVDPSLNPYLGAAMMLAAGLEGIENELDPGDPVEDNMYELTPKQLEDRGIRTLPRTLLEAVDAFKADSLARQVFGEDLFHSFARLKEQEWWNYHNAVSAWEVDEYLTKF